MKRTIKKYLALLLAAALLCAPCVPAMAQEGDEDAGKTTFSSVTLNKTSLELTMGSYERETLIATLQPGNVTPKSSDGLVTWSSDDRSVATVTQGGRVDAKGRGTATVTVTVNDNTALSASCTVTVKTAPESVTLDQTSLEMNAGENATLKATVLPSEADQAVTWASSDDKIATVSGGAVHAVGEGTATITAAAEGFPEVFGECAVTVKAAVTGITLSSDKLEMQKGDEEKLTVKVTPEGSEYREITWSTNNRNVATVDENGLVTAAGGGNATITATAVTTTGQRISATCAVTVVVPADSLTLAPETLTLPRLGATGTLIATVTPSDTTDKVTWESSDESVATVDQNGKVTAKKAGKANITVKVGNFSKTCAVTVEDPDNLVSSIKIFTEDNPSTVPIGGTVILTAFLSPDDADNPSVIWSSNSDQITFLEVSDDESKNDGKPTLTINREPGQGGSISVKVKANKYVTTSTTVNIYCASVENGSIRASHGLTISPPTAVTGIALSDTELSLVRGMEQELRAIITPAGAANQTVRWTSSSPNVTVTADSGDSTRAIVKGIASTGTESPVTVTATTGDGGYTATCQVYVTDQTVSATSVSVPETLTLDVGGVYTLIATVLPAYASNKAVEWESDDETIVTVDATGRVTGVSPGITTVTATADGKSGKCTVTVSGVVLDPGKDFPLPAGGSATMYMHIYGLASDVTSWNWNSSNTNVARVVGGASTAQVTGIAEGTTTITVTGGGFSDSHEIKILDAAAYRNLNADAYYENGQLNFSKLVSALQTACKNMTYNGTLDYIVNVTVPTVQGTLFDHYVAEPDPGAGLSSATRYYVSADNSAGSANLISNIYFVPRNDYTGSVTINYNGVSTDGNQYAATVTLTGVTRSDVQYNVFNGEPVRLKASDFAEYVQKQAGRSMRYVTFDLPASRYGKLQYFSIGGGLYEREVSADARFYTGIAPALDDVWFVPNKTNRNNFSITFHAYDSNSVKLVDGTISVVVATTNTIDRDGTDLSYSVPVGERIYFDVDDFAGACEAAGLGELDYIYFHSQPSSARGTLYYGTNSWANTGSSYPLYRNASGSRRSIGNLYFRAAGSKSAAGTTSFGYTGYDVNGDSFTGMIRITVTSGSGTELYYSASAQQRVWLSGADFSNASYSVTDRELNYIRFDNLPPSTRGTLYSLSNTASTGQNYYYTYSSANSSRRLIDDLSFVPAANFSGTVVIPYTGYNDNGASFTGTVTIRIDTAQKTPGITVTERDPNATPLVFSSRGEAIRLRGTDFLIDAADKLKYDLASVRFTQPSSSVGRLCTNYISPTQYTPLDTVQSFTPQMISSVWFQPKAGFSGSAAVPFFAADITGKSYAGTLIVQVAPPEISGNFDDMYGHAWAVPAVDFLARYGVVEGTGGRMYSPDAPMTRGDFVLMLSRAFSFPYYGTQSFDDVPVTAYYAPAIASAKALGIAAGETRTQQWGGGVQSVFRPSDPITREEAGVFLYLSMCLTGTMPAGSRENLAVFPDGGNVSDHAVEAMSSLALLGVFAGDDLGRLNPKSTLTRAEMAVILHRAIT